MASAAAAAHFLIGFERKPWPKREQRAHYKEYGPGHDHHMQARDREDMREASIAHRLLHLIRDATLLAGHQRNRDLSRLAREHVADAFVDGGAHGIDRLPGGEVERRRGAASISSTLLVA